MPIVPILYTPVQSSPVLAPERSERVILRRYLNREELVQDGNLLHDVVAHLGDFGEEEEGEETGYTAEAGGEATAGMGLVVCVCVGWVEGAGDGQRKVEGGEDVLFRGLLEGEAVVVLGDGVSVVVC